MSVVSPDNSLNKTLEEDSLLFVDGGIDKPKLVPRAVFPVIDGAVARELTPGGGIRLVDALLGLDRNVGTKWYVIPATTMKRKERKVMRSDASDICRVQFNIEARHLSYITHLWKFRTP